MQRESVEQQAKPRSPKSKQADFAPEPGYEYCRLVRIFHPQTGLWAMVTLTYFDIRQAELTQVMPLLPEGDMQHILRELRREGYELFTLLGTSASPEIRIYRRPYNGAVQQLVAAPQPVPLPQWFTGFVKEPGWNYCRVDVDQAYDVAQIDYFDAGGIQLSKSCSGASITVFLRELRENGWRPRHTHTSHDSIITIYRRPKDHHQQHQQQ